MVSATLLMSKEDTKENQDDESWDIPEPPDGGWGWVIVAVSFLCNMVVDGISYSFGIFFMEFVQYYRAPKGRTAWIGSLLSGCYLSAGPIVSALTNRFGCRSVTIVGSIVASIAFILSTFAPSVDVLMLTYGIMGGIGFGLIYLPAIVSVSYYFSTKRAFATGIAVCGSGMGAFVFAPICQALLSIYDWKGSLLILSGLTLNCMVFGALMRPLESADDQKTVSTTTEKRESKFDLIQHDDGTLETKEFNTEPGVQSRQDLDQMNKTTRMPFITLSSIGETLKPGCEGKNGTRKLSLLQLKSNLVMVHPDMNHKPISPSTVREISRRNLQFPMESTSSISNIPLSNRNNSVIGDYQSRRISRRRVSIDVHKHTYRREYYRPIYRKDIFYSGSVTSLAQYNQSQKDIRTYVASVTSLPKTDGEEEESSCVSPAITVALKEMLNFSLLKDCSFMLLCISNIFGMMGFYIPFVYITDSSTLKGIPKSDAAFILSIIGITNTLGRMVFGWFADRPRVSSLWVNNVCLLLSGICVLCIPFTLTYTTVLIVCTFFAVFISAYMCLTSIILVDLVGLDRLTNAFGLLSLFRGAASIIGSPVAGSIYDITGSYTFPFFAAGGMLIMAAILSSIIPFVKKCSNSNELNQPPISLEETENGESAQQMI
ncbi:LOW QUALITY PROTEIN: monocarboxylate transporter 12-like [Centruroides vittatus]|uniref:LOW QUALITY PROTEIN: monocarboxylate transporter 12-like n=1 Tax=Centruroides vittatus TaxID=120091 RepID=UPI00350FF3D6